VQNRHDLTDEQWARLEPLLPRDPGRGGRWADHRTTINGVLWRIRTGSPWRDLPPQYGNWLTVYKRHRRWSADGTWTGILDRLRAGCDAGEGEEWTMSIDSTIARAHRHAAGARHAPLRERCNNKLKAFRDVATRFDKRACIYDGTIDIASVMIWLRDPVW